MVFKRYRGVIRKRTPVYTISLPEPFYQDIKADSTVMCVIYLAQPNNTPSTISAFAERDLKNLAPAECEKTGIVVYSITPRPLIYDAFVSDLHNIVRANHFVKYGGKRLAYRNVFKYSAEIAAPVVPPVVYITFDSATEADKHRWLGWGMTENNQSRGNVYFGTPTYTNFKSILSEGPDLDHRSPYGIVSGSGYLAFLYAWNGLRIFCSLSGDATSGHYNTVPVTYKSFTAVGSTIGEDMFELVKPNISDQEFAETTAKFQTTEKDGSLVGQNIAITEQLGVVPVPFRGKRLIESAFSDPSSDMFNSGMVFPFFEEMVEPSKDFAAIIFFRVFGRCFAEDGDSFANNAVVLRRGFRNLAYTRQGKELQHAFFGLLQSVETGARLSILVQEGQYKGFVLESPSLRALVRNTTVKAGTKDEVNRGIDSINQHTDALLEIYEILSQVKMVDGGEQIAYDPEKVNKDTARTLALNAHKHLINDLGDEDKEKLRKSIRKLEYSQKYYEFTTENFNNLLDVLCRGEGWPKEAPYYVTPETIFATNPITKALAVFGPRVPSLVGGNVKKSIPRPGKHDDNLVVDSASKKRHLPYIPVYEKPILQAVNDWQRVRNTRGIYFCEARKNKKEFTFNFKLPIGGEEMLTSYAKLQVFIGNVEEVPDADPRKKGKKRKGADKGDEPKDVGPPSKKFAQMM